MEFQQLQDNDGFRRSGRWALAVSMAVALVMVSAAPASAAASGSGVGAGLVTITGQGVQSSPPCARIDSVTVRKSDVGDWIVNSASYTGAAAVTISVPTHYADPNGTHTDTAPGNLCAAPIDTVSGVTATVDSAYELGGPGVDCTFTGTFRREGTQVTFQLSGTCSVRSVTGVTSTSAATLTQTGQFLGCPPFGPTPVPVTYPCLYQGTYILS